MARVCLECATPKKLGTGHCNVCNASTVTWDGEARVALCKSCTKYKPDYGCTLADDYDFGLVKHAISVTLAEPLMAREAKFNHSCDFYKRNHKVSADSPNPMSKHDIAEAKMWLEGPSAFWLDPRRWDHVTNPYEQACIPPNKDSVVSTVAFAGLALIAGAFSKKTG